MEGKSCGSGPTGRPPASGKERQDPGWISRIDRRQPKIDTGMSRVGNPNEARRHPRCGARELKRFLAARRDFGKSLDDLFGQVTGKPALQKRRGAEDREVETRRGG